MIDTKFMYRRIRYVITNPARAWKHIRDENRTVKTVILSYLLPLISVVSLAAFAGTLIYTHSRLSILFPIIISVKLFLSLYLTILLSAWVINEISVAYRQNKNYEFSFKLVSYAITPLIVIMVITRLFPLLMFLNILGFYGAFILWVGINTMEDITSNGAIRFFILALTSIIIFYLSISWILGSVLEGLYFLIFS